MAAARLDYDRDDTAGRIREDGWLRLHFGMTGFLEYYKNDGGLEHVRARNDFSNGYQLAHDCQRKLGELGLVEDVDRFIEARDLGPDPLDRCPKCDGALTSDTFAGRTAYYCARHQRPDR